MQRRFFIPMALIALQCHAQEPAPSVKVRAVTAAAAAPMVLAVQDRPVQLSYKVNRSSIPPVVVQFTSTDPARVQEMSEDLDIMTHIIDRALSEQGETDSRPTKMGIDLYFTSAQSVRALYVEDFGALIMVKVDFPLQGAASEKAEKPEQARDTEWERARKAVLGISEDAPNEFFVGGIADFDPERVNVLKANLVRALKNAANIRHIKTDETLSISVFGTPAASQQLSTGDTPAPASTSAWKRTRASAGNSPNKFGGSAYGASATTTKSWTSSKASGTVLTLRVKKADVDAFSKGTLDEEAFTQKVTFNSYLGSGHNVTSVNSWVTR